MEQTVKLGEGEALINLRQWLMTLAYARRRPPDAMVAAIYNWAADRGMKPEIKRAE